MTTRGFALALGAVGVSAMLAGPAVAEPTAVFEAASEAAFSRPHDLVLSPDATRLYVSDLGNDAIKVLDPETLATVGVIGQDEVRSPHDVAFDAQGRLLVADTGNDRIAIYEVVGDGGRLVGEIGGLSKPEGVVATPDGKVILTNVGFHNVQVYVDGKMVVEAGSYGRDFQSYERPHDIDVDRQGRVYVSDPGNHRIQQLDQRLELIVSIGGESYDFYEPKYFAIRDDGWLFIADEYNHQIKVLDPALNLVFTFGEGKPGLGPNRFNYPEGVEVLGDTLWISDTRNGRIVRYRVSGLAPGSG